MRRHVGIAAAVLVVLFAAVVLGGGALLNTDASRSRIIAAIERATGHQVRIDGPIAVAWSLEPAFSMQNVAILNPPGFSRPELVTVRRIEARVALLPLLEGRIEVPGVWISDPDIRLERDASGRGNWAAAAPPATVTEAPAAPREHMPVAIARVQVVNGSVAWPGAPTVQVRALQATPGGGPVTASVVARNTPFEIAGSTQAAAPGGVPFELTAVGGGIALAVSGTVGAATPQPIAFVAKTADLSAVSALAGRSLPPLQQVVLTGQLTASGPAGLTLTAGPSDLGQFVPGLALASFKASLAAMDQPVRIEASATLRTLPIAVAASAGPRAATTPVLLQLAADGATIGVQASVDGADLHWTEAAVAARIPDLARTAALAGIRLPGLRDAAIDVRLQPAATGTGVLLRGLRVASAQGDLAGDLALILAPRRSLKGSLISQRLDLGAWTQPAEAAADAGPVPTQAAVTALPPHWLIPDRPLPFAALQSGDADLRWTIGTLALHGAAYTAGSIRLLLQDGRLRIDPAAIMAPGGPIRATVQADASANTAALVLHAPAMDAAGLAAAAGIAGAMTGTVDLDIDLHATGTTPHEMAATATGHAAMALTDGEIENAALGALFGPALRGANIPFDANGQSRVRCLATRIDAADGQAVLRALALDTSKLRLDGDGTIGLGTETMDLHLRPTIRLGPTSVAIPVHLAGPWRAPKAAADKGAMAPGRFGISIGAATPDPCGPALAEIHAP